MSANNPRVRQYEIALLRHGRTEANDLDIIQGRIDNKTTALNSRGVKQAEECHAFLKNKHFFAENAGLHVYTSPLKRAARTTEIVVGTDWLSSVTNDVRLTEREMGVLTGKPRPKEREENVQGQEPDDVMSERVLEFWDAMLLSLSQKEIPEPQADEHACHILIVTHNGLIHSLLRALLERPEYDVLEGVTKKDGQPMKKGDKIPSIWNGSITTIVVTETQNDEGTHWSGIVGPFSSLQHLQEFLRDDGSDKPLDSQGIVPRKRSAKIVEDKVKNMNQIQNEAKVVMNVNALLKTEVKQSEEGQGVL